MNSSLPRCPRSIRLIGRIAVHSFAMIGFAAVVWTLCFDHTRIVSGSMSPTLRGEDWDTGDRVISERVTMRFRDPIRWEVVTIRSQGKQIMKRIVGLPGERIQVREEDNQVLIDGREIHPPEVLSFLHYIPYGKLVSGGVVDCGDGYFVMGDFTRDSDDSRFNGPVPREQIVGRPLLVYWPAEHRGVVR